MSIRTTQLGRIVTAMLVTSLTITAGTAAERDGAKARGSQRWENTIKAFESNDAKTPPPKGAVLLIGGSNARRWTDVDDCFPKHAVINRGFGGAKLTDVLYFADRIVLPYRPSIILVNAGGNDLKSGSSPEQIRGTARDLVAKVQAGLPDTRIFLIGLPIVRRAHAAAESRAAILAMNSQLAEFASTQEDVEFIDLVPAFLDEHDKFRPELFVEDGTHFSPKGYAVITELMTGKF